MPRRLQRLPMWVSLAALASGGVAWLLGWTGIADGAWLTAILVALIPATVATVRDVVRREPGVDIVAVLAMAGAIALGEMLAGAIIAVMLTGGEALERYAAARAKRELSTLLERAPRVAHRHEGDHVRDVDVDDIRAADALLVKPGEVVPTDGTLTSDHAVLDVSALTGEPEPAEVKSGDVVLSGAVNAGSAFRLRATATAADSTYAGIVRLVEEATESKAPFVRMADRYAGRFVLLTLAVAGGAWLVSGSATRALAVLVVATPCPLILAAPAAIVGGLSTAARHGIIVKGGGALEALAQVRVALLDKTGTITSGQPEVARVHVFGDHEATEVVGLAASLEQVSLHPFAPAIVAAARDRGLEPSYPDEVDETLGTGIHGRVGDHDVAVGRLDWVAGGTRQAASQVRSVRRRAAIEGTSTVFVSIDGVLAGAIILADAIRPDSVAAIRALRRAGIERVVMVSGDRHDVADLVGDSVGVDRVLAERRPEDKVATVEQARIDGPVVMVGDGINDAPALAAADVGVSMGARGASAASEAADVILTSDRLAGLPLAIRISQRTHRIALQSVLVGMGLSTVAMGFAAMGIIAPVAGALLQEGIDVAVILNALRALRDPDDPRRATVPHDVPMDVLAEHEHLASIVDDLTAVAGRLEGDDPAAVRRDLERLRRFLEEELLPHELREERDLYPAIAALYDGEDPTPPMARSHREITRLIRLYGRLLDELPRGTLEPDELHDLRRLLYGLHAILHLHNSLEDELYAELRTAVG